MVVARRIEPRPVLAEIVGVGARQHLRIGMAADAAVKVGLAEKAAVHRVGHVGRIVEFPGIDHAKVPPLCHGQPLDPGCCVTWHGR